MAVVTPLHALYWVVRHTLGENAFPDRVPDDTTRPYYNFFIASGGNVLFTTGQRNASYVLTVKCVANDQVQAFDGQYAIQTLLDGQGSQEGNGLAVHAGWGVLTVTQDREVYLVEAWQGTEEVYHAGHQYRFNMETK